MSTSQKDRQYTCHATLSYVRLITVAEANKKYYTLWVWVCRIG